MLKKSRVSENFLKHLSLLCVCAGIFFSCSPQCASADSINIPLDQFYIGDPAVLYPPLLWPNAAPSAPPAELGISYSSIGAKDGVNLGGSAIIISNSTITPGQNVELSFGVNKGTQILSNPNFSFSIVVTYDPGSTAVCYVFDPSLNGTFEPITLDGSRVIQETNIGDLECTFTGLQNTVVFQSISFNTNTPQPSPTPSLSIPSNSVIVTQAVNNFILPGQSNITLVQGKSAAILVPLAITSPIPNDQTPVTIVATMPDGTTATSSPIPMASIGPTTGPVFTQATIIPVPVNSSGSGLIKLKASASDAISGNTSISIVAKQTNPLTLVYFPMTGSSGPISQGDFATHVSQSNLLIQGMYPLAENGIITSSQGPLTTAALANNSAGAGIAAINDDLAELQFEATIANPGVQSAIGIVPSNYFSDRGKPATLGTVPQLGMPPYRGLPALITEGYWAATAHEVSHNFGLEHVAGDPLVNGFWVDQNNPVNGWGDLLASGNPLLFNALSSIWISSNEYSHIFSAQLVNPSDPQVVTIAGFLSKTGAVTLKPIFYLSNGLATPKDSTADGTITALDSNNDVLAQSSFFSSFNLEDDDGNLTPVDSSFFLVQLPFSQGATSVQIAEAGKVVSTIDPNSQLLVDTIQEIPSTSFVGNAKLQALLLLDQAKGIESFLALCKKIQNDRYHDNWAEIACTDGGEQLVLALRAEINKDLNDSTITTSPLQLTKSGILKTVDFVALQLLGNPTIQAAGHAFTIKVLPDDSRGVLSVSVASQGTYGSVVINSNGSITYKPNSTKPELDSFTITIQDTDGATVTKTVSIIGPCLNDSMFSRWANRF